MRRVLLLLALLAGGSLQAADYRLWLELPDHPDGVVELGKPFNVLLWYRGPADLDRIVSGPWRRDFAVDRGYATAIDGTWRLRLRLTPRRTGTLTLSPLQLGGADTEARTVSAVPARENGQALAPDWSVTTTSPWQREELRVQLSLSAMADGARLAVDPFNPDGFTVTALPARNTVLPDGRSDHRYTWLLRPTRPGDHRLELPRLHYIRDGVPVRRFHFPLVDLAVRALPPYVTPTVPVGRVEPDPRHGDRLHGAGMGAADLAAALRRAGLSASVAETRTPDTGTRSEARIDWSRSQPDAAGLVYFAADSGRLANLHPQPPARLPIYLAVVALVALVVLLWWQRGRLAGTWRRRRYRARLRAALARAGDADQQARAVLALPLPGHRTPPRTLHDWLRDYSEVFAPRAQEAQVLAEQVARLEAARFGAAAQGTRLRV